MQQWCLCNLLKDDIPILCFKTARSLDVKQSKASNKPLPTVMTRHVTKGLLDFAARSKAGSLGAEGRKKIKHY